MHNYFKSNARYLMFSTVLLFVAVGAANAVTYTYKGAEYCDYGITIGAGTGVISCATGSVPSVPRFHFSSGLACSTGFTVGPKKLATQTVAGIDVNEVSCD